jgi:hypothetical protein
MTKRISTGYKYKCATDNDQERKEKKKSNSARIIGPLDFINNNNTAPRNTKHKKGKKIQPS